MNINISQALGNNLCYSVSVNSDVFVSNFQIFKLYHTPFYIAATSVKNEWLRRRKDCIRKWRFPYQVNNCALESYQIWYVRRKTGREKLWDRDRTSSMTTVVTALVRRFLVSIMRAMRSNVPTTIWGGSAWHCNFSVRKERSNYAQRCSRSLEL